ncbi:hypothetical protein Tco_0444653, partial [Tanacetum coccineum]
MEDTKDSTPLWKPWRGTGVKPGVPDVPTYRSDDEEEIPWKSSDEDDNDDNEDDDDDDQGVLDD